MEVSVFERTSTTDKIISPMTYNLVLGLTLLWGFWVNWMMVEYIPVESISGINPWIFFGGYFASCFFGIYLFNNSEKPIVSFIGYNFVVVPFGLIINLVVSGYNPEIVSEAIRTTGLVTFVMMLLGSMYPAFFQRIVGGLTIALICVIIVELIQIFIFNTHHGIMDWIVVAIFCGYIGYDWARANAIPKTYDNAIDSAAALYIDIINLFLRILRILGRR
ncbi:Bax inhibitor-1 family protein [Thalassotalea litorea]|uniref:Bax inhibitor-1 family protein n=1 Tax=Thalassotalea litorea TaxID=2020715 RepID=UPI003735F66A